jgi:hypothetical protein
VTKAKAIKLFCFDCAGESNKEVTLCSAFDCQLWQFRTGQTTGTMGYKARMTTAKANYAEDLKEMAADGLEIARFFQFSSCKRAPGARKSFGAGRGQGSRGIAPKKALNSEMKEA